MDTHTEEIADGIHRISTLIPEVAPPAGFTMNQFLIVADEPLLFHTGPRAMYPLVAEAVSRIVPVESLRWISFGHVESDECGAVNSWLAGAPRAEVLFGTLGCDVSLNDLCDRPPRAVTDDEVIDLGGKRVRWIGTPHVPHGWEAGVLFEETTGTLFSGDLFSQIGNGPAVTTDDVVGPALAMEEMFHATCMTPQTGAVLRALGELDPRTLAIMHGSSYRGDGRRALHDLARGYERLAQTAVA